MTPKISLQELLEDDVWTCGRCSGPLYVHKYLCDIKPVGRERKARKEIKAICICPICSHKR